MSQLWSEINKVVNVVNPASQTATTGGTVTSDIVNMENYKALTFLVHTGATAVNNPTITVYGGETSTGATTAIAYKYRKMITAVPPAATSDTHGDLTDATSAGFAITASKEGAMYIIEVDPSTVAAADTTDQTYDHVKMILTNSGTAAAQIYGIVAILSEPRYPQAVLVTAID